MSSNWGSSSGSSSRSDVENSFYAEELFQIGTRCSELRKEKEMLRESQSQSVELVRRLELNANSLSESRLEDKRRIQTMEKELLNCYQEIDYLRDQVNVRGLEVNYLSERVLDLEVKVTESGNLEEEVQFLREELCTSKSEQLLLLQELERTETELHLSRFSVEKLEESVSSLTLESQCEIESMKLDVVALEQALFDAKKVQGESIQENEKFREIVKELQLKFREAQEDAECLEKENKELRERCVASERNVEEYCQRFKEQLENESETPVNAECFFAELNHMLPIPDEARECLHEIIKDAKLRDEMEDMARQICEYEDIVRELKDELKEEKLKAKEEAEDLTQEMAELRYKMTCLLEEECKRRACIEQASLQRIANLEAQIKREKNKSSSTCVIPLSAV
ncbi:PREDICTED: intracellular protein transport protein USO1-like [Camelina sativa]|uniref:Intracellular protein transport protein USO1-like n=1 Tax=Camelina sativa TaxID=90675 RepID=A0ABM0VJ55_CAMSA|nr:PREDICTED: intracellular protein transport protein USO1-like [Camelina sativa]XP_010457044.1 PREDICTED: intracellular protein transport protein USO1-like [Camelina sativa]